VAERPLSREAHRLRMARLIHCTSSSFGRVLVGAMGGVVEVVDVDKMGISASKSSSSEFKALAWVGGRRWRMDVANVWGFDDLGRCLACFGLCNAVWRMSILRFDWFDWVAPEFGWFYAERDLFKDSNRLAKIALENRNPVISDDHRYNKMVYCFELKAQSHTCGR